MVQPVNGYAPEIYRSNMDVTNGKTTARKRLRTVWSMFCFKMTLYQCFMWRIHWQSESECVFVCANSWMGCIRKASDSIYSLLKITRSCIRLCGQASVWKLTVHSVVWCNLDSLNGANVYVKPRKSEAIEEKWEMGNVNISGCLFITYTFVIEVKP